MNVLHNIFYTSYNKLLYCTNHMSARHNGMNPVSLYLFT